ncbi:insulinase family protein [bacterium]|nr:MAG: insulinase family protein [bacterium]
MTRLYGSSPYSNHFEGSIKSLGTLTRDDVFEFYKTYFRPNNLIIAMVGDIKAEEAENILLEKFSGWKPGNFNEPVFPDIELSEKSKVYIIKKKGAVQSDLRMGHKGINRNHKDFIPLSVMNTMLGGFFTSRINQNLREVNGYTYGARTYFNWHKNQGDFSVETNVQNNKTSSAVKEIIKEIRNMKYEKVSPEELETAKNYIIGNFPLQLETPNAVASKLIGLELYGLEKNFYNTYISRLNSVMIEDIFRVSQEYLFPENLLISAAGNPDEIKGGLEEIAEVEIIENID